MPTVRKCHLCEEDRAKFAMLFAMGIVERCNLEGLCKLPSGHRGKCAVSGRDSSQCDVDKPGVCLSRHANSSGEWNPSMPHCY